jgi:hypothetical protein
VGDGVTQHLFLAVWTPMGKADCPLLVRNSERHASPLVQELYELAIQLVDPSPPILKRQKGTTSPGEPGIS